VSQRFLGCVILVPSGSGAIVICAMPACTHDMNMSHYKSCTTSTLPIMYGVHWVGARLEQGCRACRQQARDSLKWAPDLPLPWPV
jgi:hypothetical protein